MVNDTNFDKLRIRYFEVEEFDDGFIVRDPFGLFEDLFFTPQALYLIGLFDGNRTLDEIKSEFLKATGIVLSDSEIIEFIKQMDNYYLFYNERFINRIEEEREKILKLEYKKLSFFEDITQIKNFIKQNSIEDFQEDIIALIVPHIDIKVAMDTYLKTYSKIKNTKRNIFFIFGVAHSIHLTPFSIFPKNYFTDRVVKVHNEIINNIRNLFFYDIHFDVLAYKNEHSVEFPILFLDSIFEDFYVIPSIVAYAKNRDELKIIAERIYEAIKEYKDKIIFISSIDLSHVGKKFGDKVYYEPNEVDLKYIDMLLNLKNDEAFEFLEKYQNQTRIDGQFTNYVFLEILKLLGVKEGILIDYKNYYEALTESGVSYCSIYYKV
ncbi:MAG: AmmeMemoRadiSam system protein B [candidate division WOR-3 bacterium]